jgi:hypothetical protein
MKTLKISESVHSKLTSIVGRLMAETGQPKTYSDALEAMLSTSIMLSPELLNQVRIYMKSHLEMSYLTEREFIEDAVRSRLTCRFEDK